MRASRIVIGLFILGLGVTAIRAATFVETSASFSELRVYPNPWRADRHARISVTFAGLPPQATIRLYTLSGHLVRTLESDAAGNASWDRTNQNGDVVGSGLYLYKATCGENKPFLGKLALIR